MGELYSQCCGAPPISDTRFCAKCRDGAGFEELCTWCADPCLVDGRLIVNQDGEEETVSYIEDRGGFEQVFHDRCITVVRELGFRLIKEE